MSLKEFSVQLIPQVDKVLSDKKKSAELIDYITNWFDRSSETLLDTGLTEKPFFSNKDSNIVITLCGLDKKEINRATKDSDKIVDSWRILQNEIYISFILAIRFYEKAGMKKEVRILYTYLCLRIYASRYPTFLPYGAKREVMDYTLAHLSNKFDLKRIGNFLGAMEKLAENNHVKYIKYITANTDYELTLYIQRLYTRVNGFLKNLYNEYKTNYTNKNYMNSQSENETRGEGDGEHVVTRETDNSKITGAANKYLTKFMTSGLDHRMIMVAAKSSDISRVTLTGILEKIRQYDADSLVSIVSDLLALYIEESKENSFTRLKSKTWLPFVLAQFSKTNTENTHIKNIKSELDVLLEKYCSKFSETNREATRSAYRRALLFYIAFSTQAYI
jgi:hypothetical protein